MHRRSLIIIAIVALLLVTGLTVGLVETRAQGEPDLVTVTPAQLLANVAQRAGEVTAVSGDVNWKNDVLGLSMLSFGGQGSGDLTALLSSGSGRIWVGDGKARFDIQGATGDTIIVGDSTSVWVYSSANNTATEYTLPAGSKATEGADADQSSTTQSSQTAVTDPVAAINDFVQKLAPDATLAVSDPVTVAGQSCYVLSLIPKAANTVLGSAQVAIDSKTYLPLKFDVYAKGTAKPVLTVGFTSVSYSTPADSIFAFTPPANATVTHKTLTLPAAMAGGPGTGSDVGPDSTGDQSSSTDEQAPLTLAEAAAKAGFAPLAAQTTDPALAFGGASVIPAQDVDLRSLLDQLQSGALGSEVLGAGMPGSDAAGADPNAQSSTLLTATRTQPGPITLGPTIIQRYGQGFGTVMLVEAKIPTELAGQLKTMLAAIPLLSRTDAGGVTIYQLNTALGSVALWERDGLLFVAAGSVSQIDLGGFIASVR